MTRKLAGLLVLFVCVGLILVFVSDRIGDRTRVAEAGRTVLLPLVPLGPRDLAQGDRIELVYELPEIVAELSAGNWPEDGAIVIDLDQAGVAGPARLYSGGPLADSDIVLNYRYASTSFGLWPSDRPRLIFGDGFYLVTEGRIADYLEARYAVLMVDPQGNSVVTGLADREAKPISPGS